MNELDELLEAAPVAKPTLSGAQGKPKRCRRHQWEPTNDRGYSDTGAPYTIWRCVRCGAPRDAARSRRGKSARRLGNDQERRAEKVYGLEKIGERGQITDLRGKTLKVQMKATRAAPPVKWKAIFAALDQVNDGRMPAILLSFVRAGVPADDYFIVRGRDFLDWRGRDE